MINENQELLKVMHLIKNYCSKQKKCDNCVLAIRYPNLLNLCQCPFDKEPGCDWELQDINGEKIISVFK